MDDRKKRQSALQKEWKMVAAQEKRMITAAKKKDNANAKASGSKDALGEKKSAFVWQTRNWKDSIEQKIPPKVYDNLRQAFGKAFSLIFEKGNVIIEKTYHKDALMKDFAVRDYAVEIKGTRKELKAVRQKSGAADLTNAAVSAVEGIGLGMLGIGLPDIVVFIGVLLKGVYETALNYGYDYDRPEEKLLILKMMETALLQGEDWIAANEAVDAWIESGMQDFHEVRSLFGRTSETEKQVKQSLGEKYRHREQSREVEIALVFQEQLQRTADVFALDMLLLKFIQGLPLVGVVGGAANPIYYSRVMRYVKLKYQKRYLSAKLKKENGNRK